MSTVTEKKQCECHDSKLSFHLTSLNKGCILKLKNIKLDTVEELIFDAIQCTKCNRMMICGRDRKALVKGLELPPLDTYVDWPTLYGTLNKRVKDYILEDPAKNCTYDIYGLVTSTVGEATSNEK